MAKSLVMPRLGETMEEGVVTAWLIEPGEEFKRGQTIAEVETDKTIVELPALENGKLLEIIAPAGTTVAVGKPLAKIDASGAKAKRRAGKAKAATKKQTVAKKPSVKNPGLRRDGNDAGKLLASPNARRVARATGTDLADVQPTGRRGRRTAADVEAAIGQPRPKQRKLEFVVDKDTGLAVYHWPTRTQQNMPPVLLIHGLFGNASTWAGVATNLSNMGSDVYAVDLPGHGNSNSDLVDINQIAALAHAAVRRLTSSQLRVAGLSLGAAVAAKVALLDDDCAALYLMCPAGLGDSSNEAFITAMLDAANGASASPALAHLGKHGANLDKKAIDKMEKELQANASQLAELASKCFPAGGQGIDIVPVLNKLRVPVKALFATNDQVFPWQDSANLPVHVAAHFLAGAGHVAHMEEQGRVVEFLSS